MSMFYELLMRAKETVYAIIQGTLTENPKGVFSGFTDNNGLIIKQGTPEDFTELQIEVTMPPTIPNTGTQSIINLNIFSLRLYGKQIDLYGGTSDIHVIPQSAVVGGSNYVIKAVRDTGKTFDFFYKKDGGEWVQTSHWTSNMGYGSNIRIGNSTTSGRGWKGTINMNNTYIKRPNGFWFKGKTKQEE